MIIFVNRVIDSASDSMCAVWRARVCVRERARSFTRKRKSIYRTSHLRIYLNNVNVRLYDVDARSYNHDQEIKEHLFERVSVRLRARTHKKR